MFLKDGKLYPIHQLGDVMEINKNKSFLILSAISKVSEKIMYERLSSFFDQKNMFYSEQFGFCGKRSTIDALAELTE